MMTLKSRLGQGGLGRWLSLVAVVLLLCGCKDGAVDWSFLFPDKAEDIVDKTVPRDAIQDSPAYRDTIAEWAYLDGMRRLRVRGWGIVVGLGRNGSRRCPSSVRSQMIQEMYKTRDFPRTGGAITTPEQLIDDIDTAVVAVEGEIPAAATEDSTFDIIVRAIPGTETTSLAGGWLFPCDLSIFVSKGGTSWIPGRTVARASGPVFLNPYGLSEGSATRTNAREGVIIGGATLDEDRRIRLMLTTPSYPRAEAIADRVNERFGRATSLVADAVSPGEVKLRVPPSYADDARHYLSVVQHLYIPSARPGFMSLRLRELSRAFATSQAAHVEIALSWEGVGRTALPEVKKFYDHANPSISFHSAMAGVRLGDPAAIDVLERHLFDAEGDFRRQAIEVLGGARQSHLAARPLRRAMSDSDPRIRIAAYEALVKRGDPTLDGVLIGDGKFVMDLVPGDGKKLIYVKRTKDRRIALFGGSIRARPPMFFALADNSLFIDADSGATSMTVVRKAPVGGGVSPPIDCGLSAKELISLLGGEPPQGTAETVRGLGVDYTSVVLVLAKLCESGALDAEFLLESPTWDRMAMRRDQAGRPEAETDLGRSSDDDEGNDETILENKNG